MSGRRHIDVAEAGRLFSRREFFRLRLYLIELGFRDFTAYYESSEPERAALLLPSVLLPENEDAFSRRRALRLADRAGEDLPGPFILFDENPGVAFIDLTEVSPDNATTTASTNTRDSAEPDLFAAASLERLLRAGEERIFVNDREGVLVPEDLSESARRIGRATEALFAELVADRLIGADGVVTTRQRRVIADLNSGNAANLSAGPRLCVAAAEEDGGPVLADLERALRETNPVQRNYGRPAGLFNFDRSGVNFTPYLGRGEHNVFFEYLIGNRYGHFMPYSFTDAAGSPEISMDIYRELVRRGILDERGRLSELRRLDRLGCLTTDSRDDARGTLRSADAILEAVRETLRSARPLGVEDLRRDLKYDEAAIKADLANLEDLQILESLRNDDASAGSERAPEVDSNSDFSTVRRFVANTAHSDHRRFIAAYQESRIHQEINHEAAKNRGIVLAAQDAEPAWLLLLTDQLLISAPYYAFLIENFREQFGAPDPAPRPNIRIAHAYHAPTPRNPRKFPHPIVHALQMMERETPPHELKEIRDAAMDSHHESSASS